MLAWPTWEQSVAASIVALLLSVVLRRAAGGLPARLAPAAQEFALVAGLYTVWRLAGQLPLAHEDGALDRAHAIARFQDAVHLPSELSLQRWVLAHDTLATVVSYYYAVVHVPATVAFLIWLFVRHRDRYAHWRTGLALVTGACLLIRFLRVAPPRFLTDLGYVDISELHGPSVYGPIGTGASDQFAAMPSIHVAWAAVVVLGVVAASGSVWRWLFTLHLVFTVLVVSATGHHWWADGIVAIALLLLGLGLDTLVRRVVGRDEGPPPAGEVRVLTATS